MRICLEDHPHGGIAGFEDMAARMFAQIADEGAVANPDTEVRLQRAETEIEQNRIPIFLAGRFAIGTDLRQRDALVHGAGLFRQAKRDALTPP